MVIKIDPIDIDSIAVGDSATDEWTVSDAHIDAFALFSSDTNPLHMQDEYARELGFSGRVAHGMVTLSSISKLIGMQLPGPGSLWMSQEVHFSNPVYVGDAIRSRVSVDSVSKAARVVVLTTEATNVVSNQIVLRGVAKVRIPEAS